VSFNELSGGKNDSEGFARHVEKRKRVKQWGRPSNGVRAGRRCLFYGNGRAGVVCAKVITSFLLSKFVPFRVSKQF